VERVTVISSDGHAGAVMKDYRPYLDREYRDEFDGFVVEWEDHGSRNFEPPALRGRIDPEQVDSWIETMIDTGRVDGNSDPDRRLKEMESEGVVAEVLFPDFGVPFQLYSPLMASTLGFSPPSTRHLEAGHRAYNRWLSEFCQSAPQRFAGLAFLAWNDVDAVVKEIRWAHGAGLKGIVLPSFSPEFPLYHDKFAPVWETLQELGMVANSHLGITSTSNVQISFPGVPHPSCRQRLFSPVNAFFCHNVLDQLIWGGVLERYPDVRVAFTEQGSAWTINALIRMDFLYQGSFAKTDVYGVIRSRPSEYFNRQCYLGSSTFSLAEVEARHQIGLKQMMLGMDYPHHEGTLLGGGTTDYLRATLGAAGVPPEEAQAMLGETAAEVYDFDLDELRRIAHRVGPRLDVILTPPEEDNYPLGDVKRPLV
jgi:predicted TIM-barrel fold metal-dependent hydrolase